MLSHALVGGDSTKEHLWGEIEMRSLLLALATCRSL